jgi:phage major head subunit gpT-like protein
MSAKTVAAINRIYQEFKTDAIKEFDAAPRLWQEYAMEVPSSARSSLHAWLANQASVREWLGSRQAKGMSTRSWEVFNRKWELTYEFERDQIDDDLSGLMASAIMQARSLGEKFARHEDLLIAQALEAGLTSACFDGQNYFDTSHPVDIDGYTSGTFSNKLTTSALNHSNYNTALVKLMSFKNADGSPMVANLNGLLLMVPPALKLTAQQIVEVQSLTPASSIALFGTSGASQNPLYGSARVVVNPYLTSTTRYFLIAAGGMVKPVMLQRRRPLETQEIAEGSDLWFKEEKILIGGSARYAASYTLPQLAICADA